MGKLAQCGKFKAADVVLSVAAIAPLPLAVAKGWGIN
jgi:hypothetical protein